MKSKQRYLISVAALVVAVFGVAGITLTALYRGALDQLNDRLSDQAQVVARMVEAVAAYDQHHVEVHAHARSSISDHHAEATLSQIREAFANYRGLGETGEMLLAHRDGEEMEFLLPVLHAEPSTNVRVPLTSNLAGPMQRALAGESGTMIGRDYRGVRVLAAFEPVGVLDAGIVAKMDLAEVRRPFLIAGAISFAAALALIVAVALVYGRIFRSVTAELREREELFRGQFELGNVGMTITSPEKGWIEVNDRFCEIMGRTREEIQSLTWADLTHPEDLEDELINYDRMLTGQCDRLSNDVRALKPDGSVIHLQIAVACIRHEDGTPSHLIAHMEDITQRKHREIMLSRLAAISEQAPVSIVVTDLEGTVTYVNPHFEEVTGYSAEEMIGANPRLLKSGLVPEETYEAMWEKLLAGKVWRGRFTNRRRDGSLFEEAAVVSTIRDGKGNPVGYVAVKRDVTKELDLEQQLLQSQKMEAIGHLAGGVAHDFNNLLQAINGYSAMILETMEGDDPRRHDLEQVLSAGQKAAELTHQLLAFSRRQPLERQTRDLGEVVESLLKMMRRLIGEHITVRFLQGEEPVHVDVDPGQMDQVILNLAVNARDAMPEGGEIEIDIRCVTDRENLPPRLRGAESAAWAVLTMRDTGTGMDEQTQGHIFEPFFTTKEEGKGTGLGLSTVYGIVTQHGGEITVQSRPGAGTTFSIWLPLAPITDEAAEPALCEIAPSGSETILLAEDDPQVRNLTERALGRAGYRLITAPDGEVAIQMLHEHRDEIDMALLDVVMPKKTGLHVRDEILRVAPTLPVIFMSGHADGSLPRFEADGRWEIINKPFKTDALLRRVREVLDAVASAAA